MTIGANTTVFSVFNGFFLRPLPYPNDDRLVMVLVGLLACYVPARGALRIDPVVALRSDG